MRRLFRESPIIRPFRLARLGMQARNTGHTDWTHIIERDPEAWQAARQNANGPKVIIATNVGIHFGAARLDGLLGVALTLRGAQVEYLLCDQVLPACMAADQSWYPDLNLFANKGSSEDICKHCFEPAYEKLQALELPVHRYSDWLNGRDIQQAKLWAASIPYENIKSLRAEDKSLWEQALAGTLRFFARGTLTPETKPVLQSYVCAARITKIVVERLSDANGFDVALLHHGIYVPQGVAASTFKVKGTRIVTWNTAYRKKCFIFSHDDTYHNTMIDEPVDVWENVELSDKKQTKLSMYMKSRWKGGEDWISFYKDPKFDFASFVSKNQIDMSKPIIGLLTNVFWDAQLHYPANCFTSMKDWIVETVSFFATRPDLQLVIRVHPAEKTGALPSRETTRDILNGAFSKLPKNVFIVDAEDSLSTYAIAENCKACIIYATKAGIELLTMGIPVITAGEAWVKNKKLSIDPKDRDNYFEILGDLPNVSSPQNFRDRARKYAYHFFFRRMIPLEAVKEEQAWPPFSIKTTNLASLLPGKDGGLDIGCDGILNRSQFVFKDENYGEPEVEKN